MDSDDGTQPFGELGRFPEGDAVHWDTPEWREEMRDRYRGVFNADLNRWISNDHQDGWATG